MARGEIFCLRRAGLRLHISYPGRSYLTMDTDKYIIAPEICYGSKGVPSYIKHPQRDSHSTQPK